MFRRIAEIGADAGLRLGGGRGGLSEFHGLAPGLVSLEAGRPEIARDLYRGHFHFARHAVECQPAEVFSVPPPDDGWYEALHGFTWLADLAAPGLALYQAFGRSMFQIWWTQHRRTSFAASCSRLKSWSHHAGFLLSGASKEFHEQYFHAVTVEARRLAGLKLRKPADQLRQSIAVLTAALAFRQGDSLREDVLKRTAALSSLVILPDGGHIDRSPKSLLELLADLAPLREAMERQRIAVPPEINGAMERALPMLRMLCHGDGGLAVFHGVDNTAAALVRAVTEHDRSLGRPLSQAPHSGYCRMAQKSALVIVDCGAASMCDSGLAFEFSDGPRRIAGSCGMPPHASAAWREAARQVAAHSTVEIDGQSSERGQSFLARWPWRKAGTPIETELIASPGGTLVKARSSAHAAAWGMIHARELFLAASGQDFRGEDRFSLCDPSTGDWPDIGFAIRFHLHPSVKASADRKGSEIMLLLPNKDAWQFSARGGLLSLEGSIYLVANGTPRGCQQIVIRGVAGGPERVNWAFRKLDRRARTAVPAEEPPRLPF